MIRVADARLSGVVALGVRREEARMAAAQTVRDAVEEERLRMAKLLHRLGQREVDVLGDARSAGVVARRRAVGLLVRRRTGIEDVDDAAAPVAGDDPSEVADEQARARRRRRADHRGIARRRVDVHEGDVDRELARRQRDAGRCGRTASGAASTDRRAGSSRACALVGSTSRASGGLDVGVCCRLTPGPLQRGSGLVSHSASRSRSMTRTEPSRATA